MKHCILSLIPTLKRYVLSCAMAVLLLFCATANAQSSKDLIRERQKNIALALQAQSYNYETDDNWPDSYSKLFAVSDKVKKKGFLAGGYASYTWRSQEPLNDWKALWPNPRLNFIRIEVDGSGGKIEHDSYVRGKKKFNAWEVDARILTGFDFENETGTRLITPYLGIGYERLTDNAGGWEDALIHDYRSFSVVHNYCYIPIGVEIAQKFARNWDVNYRFETDILVAGNIEYSYGEIPGPVLGHIDYTTHAALNLQPRDATSDLRGGFGFRTSAKFIRNFDSYNIFGEPFVKFWYIQKSKSVQTHAHDTISGNEYVSVDNNGNPYKPIWDPSNVTMTFGVRAGVQF